MPKDREQQTPVDPEDRDRLEQHRGQGTAGTGRDILPREPGSTAKQIELTSPAFEHGDRIPEQYSRNGGNAAPPLEWSGLPEETAALALLCEDPDAPRGTFTHWVVLDLEPSRSEIVEGVSAPPGAIAGMNGFGELGWGGPAPPPGHGVHRYVFTLFALSEPLGLPPGSTASEVREAAGGRILAQGELIGTFER